MGSQKPRTWDSNHILLKGGLNLGVHLLLQLYRALLSLLQHIHTYTQVVLPMAGVKILHPWGRLGAENSLITAHPSTIKKQPDTNLPSQIKPVKLQKNLYHHGHAARKKSRMIFTTAGFTSPSALGQTSLLWGTSSGSRAWSRAAGSMLPRCTDTMLSSAILNTLKSIKQVLKFHKGAIDLIWEDKHQITSYSKRQTSKELLNGFKAF